MADEVRYVIHERTHDMSGAGKWDINTTRYIPIYGGSRSRLPVMDDEDYPRYPGFVGIDAHLTPTIHRVAQLYNHLGGKPSSETDFTQLILGQTLERLEAEAAEGDDSPAL